MISEEPIFLDCPFFEKDEVKKLGAKFNGGVKKWFIPPGVAIEPFAKWLPKQMEFDHLETPTEETTGVSLYELMLKVKDTIEEHYASRYWVRAEVVNVSHKTHVYLELSDHDSDGREVAQARAMIWSDRATALLGRFEQHTGLSFTAGIKVLLQVHVEFHPLYGLSLNVLEIDPNFTLGEMEAKLNRLRARLQTEGIYAQNKQFATVREFCKVAIIAPPQAAGLGDFKSQADGLAKAGLCEFHYYSASFQGQNTVEEIPAAIALVNADHQQQQFDALVLIRGGGPKADLYQLNEYAIAKAICTAQLPVVVGIGHERDKTLLDEVAQFACHTPSLVIAHISSTIVQNARNTKQHWQGLLTFASDRLNRARVETERLNAQVREQVVKQVGGQRNRLAALMQTVNHASQTQLQNARQRIRGLMEQVLLGDPKRVMRRGYAIIRNSQEQILTTKVAADQEKSLIIEFKDGRIVCQRPRRKQKNVG
jgi:exodeoxyribonuclease VII large subunit